MKGEIKMFKKILAIIVSMAILFSASASVFATTTADGVVYEDTVYETEEEKAAADAATSADGTVSDTTTSEGKEECAHQNTEIINQMDATAECDGYTGDIYCADCEYIIEFGETIAAAGGDDTVTSGIMQIAVRECPTKITYAIGEELDTTGLVLYVWYTDGTVARVTEGYTIEGFDSSVAGAYCVYVWYGGYQGEFWVEITESDSEVGDHTHTYSDTYYCNESYSTHYRICEECGEMLDESACVFVTVKTEDGLTISLCELCGRTVSSDNTTDECEHYYTEIIGQIDATAECDGYTGDIYCIDCGCIIEAGTVIPATGSGSTTNPDYSELTIVYARLATLPDKTNYSLGESFDSKGMNIVLTWSDYSTSLATSDMYTVSGFNSKLSAMQIVTVNINDTVIALQFPVYVDCEPEYNEYTLTIRSNPTKTEYAYGEAFEAEGLVLGAINADGMLYEITEGYTISNYDPYTLGSQTIIVNYMGNTTYFYISVVGDEDAEYKRELVDVYIASEPNCKEYSMGDGLNTDGLELGLVFNDGTEEIINQGYTCVGYNSQLDGCQTVYVYYGKWELWFEVLVITDGAGGEVEAPDDGSVDGEDTENPDEGKEERQLYDISILSEPNKIEYYVGESLVTSGLQLEAYYSDGTVEIVDSGFEISGFSTAAAGEYEVAVIYGGFYCTYYITVVELPLDKATLTIESKQISVQKDTVEIAFNLSGEEPITNLGIENITFDENNFELVSGVWTLPTDPGFQFDYSDNDGVVSAGAVYDDATDCNGAIFTLTLKILDTATESATSVSCDFIAKQGDSDIETMVLAGIIELTGIVRGDVNADGKVNNKDVMYLLNYILFPERFPLLEEDGGDIDVDFNTDGKVNKKDVIKLLNHINFGYAL